MIAVTIRVKFLPAEGHLLSHAVLAKEGPSLPQFGVADTYSVTILAPKKFPIRKIDEVPRPEKRGE
jgi:hypothetical protein